MEQPYISRQLAEAEQAMRKLATKLAADGTLQRMQTVTSDMHALVTTPRFVEAARAYKQMEALADKLAAPLAEQARWHSASLHPALQSTFGGVGPVYVPEDEEPAPAPPEDCCAKLAEAHGQIEELEAENRDLRFAIAFGGALEYRYPDDLTPDDLWDLRN